MSIQSSLLKAGALYALGRVTRELSGEDVRKWSKAASGLTPKDVKRYAYDTSDDLLERLGLQRRRSSVPGILGSLGSLGAGIAIGAGLASDDVREYATDMGEDVLVRLGLREPPSSSATSWIVGGLAAGAAVGIAAALLLSGDSEGTEDSESASARANNGVGSGARKEAGPAA